MGRGAMTLGGKNIGISYDGENFAGWTLNGTFSDCTFRGCNFTGAIFRGTFTECDFTGSLFHNTDVRDAYIASCYGIGISWDGFAQQA